MKTSYKIGLTILTLVLALFFTLVGLAIAASSHNVNHEGGVMFGFMSLIIGALGIIAIWLPWKKLLKKNTEV